MKHSNLEDKFEGDELMKPHRKNPLSNLEKRSPLFWLIAGLLFVAGVGLADFWTGSELAFSLFYLFPIVLVTWFAGKKPGIFISAISAVSWYVADELGGQIYSQPLIRYWNTVVRLAIFILVTQLLPALKELEREKELARVDYLTGAANRRYFFEVAQRELDRFERYQRPFSIAYIDLDDFKGVNDQWGHKIGDKCLRMVADQLAKFIRNTDTLARLGGDEFVLLLPEADQAAAQLIISRIRDSLLDEMQRNNWMVTFSIGILTCHQVKMTADELVRKADELMYTVKKRRLKAQTAGSTPALPGCHLPGLLPTGLVSGIHFMKKGKFFTRIPSTIIRTT
jgi:diguanylate cyclase (GGDEF)-like protein